MDASFSKHALERMNRRRINEETVWLVLGHPNSVIRETECTHIYQKVLEEQESKYLYRVFVNICKSPNLIITVYKTSKINKYEH